MADWVTDLEAAIAGAVARVTHGSEKFGILFSAGLDSSLIAKVCEDLGKKPTLYSATMQASQEIAHIEKASEFFNEIKIRAIRVDEVESYAKKVIAAANSSSAIHVGIGIPFYIACEEAKKDRHRLVLLGQGADELFAGYHRYLKMSERELEEALTKDLEKLKKIDLKRDTAIARQNSLELRFPYLDGEVVEIALKIPIKLKIKNGVRKYILREVARKRGLPEFICAREKKAVQYSTGVDKALRKLAKEKGKSIEEYLRSL